MSEDLQHGACPPHVADEFFALDETERSHAVYRAAGQIMAAGWRWKKGEWIAPAAPATTAGQQGEARPAPAESEALTKALNLGAQMANVCFNLKQDETLRERVRESLTDLQKQWDANILAARAALATQPAPEAEPAGERVGTVKVIGLPDSTVLGTSTSYSQEALRRLGAGEHNLHAAHPSAAALGERDTLRALLSGMDRGVLTMPYELAMGGEMACRQFYARVQSLIARIDAMADGGAK